MLRAGASAITLHELSKPGNRDTLAVVDTAYKVLQTYLKGNSRKNELYIAAHIPFFQSQVGAELAVERMYTELVRDNNQIVHAITDKEIAQAAQDAATLSEIIKSGNKLERALQSWMAMPVPT